MLLLLATGDTIAQSPSPARVASGADLLALVGASDVEAEDVLAEPSWDTSPATMLGIARRVRAALAEGYGGVVVTHGVDIMAETAFLTELMAGGPVVFTGAVRHLDDPRSDGLANLRDALTAVREIRGTTLCLNGERHSPRWATFTGEGFSSRPYPVTPLPPTAGDPESNVALIKTYPGMPEALLRTAVDLGARGVVLEGTGSGNVPVELFTTIAELTEWDIPVVIASRTHWRGDPGLAAAVGAISSGGLPPDQARVALMVALSTGGVTEVRRWFTHL